MPGKKSELIPLESRKQLLLAESELNRAQLVNELLDFKNEIQRLKHQALEVGSTALLAAKLAGAFSSVSRAFSHRDEGEKFSWISTLLNGAKTGASLWFLFRSIRRKT